MIRNGMSNWLRLDRPPALSRYLKNASIELHEGVGARIVQGLLVKGQAVQSG
jgi:hypothetical protein